ncbi:hypothetical protein SAMN04488498_12719 [Mesorhizobium albiziae]|uniref:Uncharacterized protein n=1 Tax=Neomesorhizobium albiziae TaxID=335020 RepID=A0A1I4ENJ9_9HYPH|nr:hypothetical protein SAMN04488498_12719 [Mesorhizobium albiziae]
MKLHALLMNWYSAAHDFVAPRYRPELHYMRGPGPAFARRAVMVESSRVPPIMRAPRR